MAIRQPKSLNLRDKKFRSIHKGYMNLLDNAQFFIVYPLDLENLGQLELEEKYQRHFGEYPFIILNKISGGILIECPIFVGFSLNKVLRTPTRILMRLTEFKCRDFPKLYQKISKFNWAPWMIGQTPEVICASKNSRLFDSRKIEKAIQDGINQYYRHRPVKKIYLDHYEKIDRNNLPKIYFRAVDDLVTLSIDTTGERLHLRGEKTLTGLAPIRENLAALLLIELKKYISSESFTLIDPMCGSGTFLIEAKNGDSVTKGRDFSYLHFPIMLSQKTIFPELEENQLRPITKLVGYEINAEVLTLAKRNDPDISFVEEDLFLNSTHHFTNAVVVMNPPYGIRVGENINLNYFLNVIESVRKKFNPELLGIIIPADYKIKACDTFQIKSTLPFKNGGIDVVFYTLKLQNTN